MSGVQLAPPIPTREALASPEAFTVWAESWWPEWAEARWGRLPGPPSGMPARFWVPVSALPTGQQRTNAATVLWEYLENMPQIDSELLYGVALVGPTGTGKTSLMCAFWHDLCVLGGRWPSGWWHARHLTAHLTDTGVSATERRARLNDMTTAPWLCIDDLGTDPGTEWSREVMQTVLEDRHANALPTFLTSNLTPDAMVTRYGGRTTSRLFEITKVIPMTGNSQRKHQP